MKKPIPTIIQRLRHSGALRPRSGHRRRSGPVKQLAGHPRLELGTAVVAETVRTPGEQTALGFFIRLHQSGNVGYFYLNHKSKSKFFNSFTSGNRK